MKKTNHLNQVNTQSVSEILTTQKTILEEKHYTLLDQAELLGAKDGSIELPRVEDQFNSPNENLIRSEYQRLIAKNWKAGKPWMDDPHMTFKSNADKIKILRNGESSYLTNHHNHVNEMKKEEIHFITDEFEKRNVELEKEDKMLQRDYITAKQELHSIQNQIGRAGPLIHFKSTFLYVLLLVGIGICEVPLNIQIFQKFGEAFFITIIMACSLGISIPILAHFSGVFVKQRKEKKEYLTFAILCILLFMGFNFGVSIFRAYVLAEHVGEQASNLNIIIFTCLNLILFVIGLIASYFRHDESYALENAYFKFQKEKKKYDKAKLVILDHRKALSIEKNTRLNSIQDKYLSSKENINNTEENTLKEKYEAIKTYDQLLNGFKALEYLIVASYEVAIHRYRAANLIERSNHEYPKSWEKEITPLSLKFQNSEELDPN